MSGRETFMHMVRYGHIIECIVDPNLEPNGTLYMIDYDGLFITGHPGSWAIHGANNLAAAYRPVLPGDRPAELL